MNAPADATIAELERTVAELRQTLAESRSAYVEKIEHQAATNDVLKAMSASPGDPQPVFDLIANRARDICGGYGVSVYGFDGTLIHLRAWTGVSDDPKVREAYVARFPMAPTRGRSVGRAIIDRRVIHIRDLDAEPDVTRLTGDRTVKSVVEVPMIRGDTVIGSLGMGSRERGGFSDAQIALLKTFADQAVIAITSAEAYRALQTRTTDLQQSLEYQTAISDVLKLISRSGYDLTTVLKALLDTAARLCAADFGALMTRSGDAFRASAIIPISLEHEAFVRRKVFVPSAHGSVVERTAFERRIVHIEDIAALSDYVTSGRGFIVSGTALGVPLFLDGDVVGVFTLHRQRVEPFAERQIDLVSIFADQAVIAIENTRLLNEQREALERQTATADIMRAINANPGDPMPVFQLILEKAHTLCGADIGSLGVFDGTHFRKLARRGYQGGVSRALEQPYPPISSIAPLLLGETVHVADITKQVFGPDARESIALYAQDGLRAWLEVPLWSNGQLLGSISGWRREPGPFSEKQVALLENFADQAVIAMENARLLTEQREALERQTATAEVLQVINASPGNLAPVFDAILEKAMQLCGVAFGELWDAGKLDRPVAMLGVPPAYAAFREQNVNRPDPGTMGARLAAGERIIHVLDLAEDDAYRDGHPGRRAMVDLGGARSALAVAMLKDNEYRGAIVVYRQEQRAFSDKEIALLENFADQAVIAMENARLLTEQREALEQQTATAEILRVINDSPGNLTPVFEAVLEKAHSVCDATMGSLALFDGDVLHGVVARGMSEASVAALRQPRTPRSGGPADRFRAGERFVEFSDLGAMQDPLSQTIATHDGVRTVLFVPLRKDTALLGWITAYRTEPNPFTPKQISLLENFAAQAVIAMENARLLTEQREALEQQTATAEVLQVINASPGDLAPVFDAMLEKAMRLCDASFGLLYTYDGERFHTAAQRGVPKALAEYKAKNPPAELHGGRSPIARLIREKRPVHTLDILDDESFRNAGAEARSIYDLGGARTILNVPLVKDDALQGQFTIYRTEVRAFSDEQIALLENFAAQAVIAMENARLLNEVRQRQEELRVTFENMGDGVALFDAVHRLVAWNRRFQDILDLPDDVLSQGESFADYIRTLAFRGEFGSVADTEEQVQRLAGLAGQQRTFERVRPDGRTVEVRNNPVADGGFVLIYADITERKQAEAEIAAARDAAEQAARTIEAAYRELKAAQANLVQAEKMASLGQLTAGIAHEIKNPLNFVNNFSELSVELLDELKEAMAPALATLNANRRADIDELTATLTGNLEKIADHGRRADGIVRSMLEHSRGASGERRGVDLNTLVEEALNLAYHGARAQDQSFNITLEREFADGMAPVTLTPQDITRVLLNLCVNGFYAARKRQAVAGPDFAPTLRVTTRDRGDAVEVRVRDNGIGVAPEIRDRLFQPFFTTKPTGEGTGLGLSISYDIVVKQHGGTITVDSEPGAFTEFVVTLPRSARGANGAEA